MKIKISIFVFLFLAVGILQSNGQTKPDMVLVNGDSFSMGNPNAKKQEEYQTPVHTVKVSDFYMAKKEVTVKEYKEFINDKSFKGFSNKHNHYMPSKPDSTWWQGHPETENFYETYIISWWGWQDQFPMFNVTWYDAVEYCNWLSEKTGLEPCYYVNEDFGVACDYSKNGYRLPTEAEWEYAARGGKNKDKYIYSGSNNIGDVAWYDDNTDLKGPKNVGTKKPNSLGIYDMSGNVWEWCNDFYSPFYYKNSPKDNPVNEYPTGAKSIRGGSWHYRADLATVTSRDGPKTGHTNYNYGFRLVRKK